MTSFRSYYCRSLRGGAWLAVVCVAIYVGLAGGSTAPGFLP